MAIFRYAVATAGLLAAFGQSAPSQLVSGFDTRAVEDAHHHAAKGAHHAAKGAHHAAKGAHHAAKGAHHAAKGDHHSAKGVHHGTKGSIYGASKVAKGFSYGETKVQGVNLGGWFVLEPWITPSIFEQGPAGAVDEYTYTQLLGKDEAKTRLEAHWSSFYIEDDFAEMKSYGLNHVRIPIGYWSVTPIDADPYVQGAMEHLATALDWADKNGLKVLIDLHGAPLSQNGFDNSGHAGTIGWTQGDSVTQTLAAITELRDKFGTHPAVSAIGLLNEPMGPKLDLAVIKQFYVDGQALLKDTDVATVFHDAFQPVTYWSNEAFGAGLSNIVLDTHHYEIFSSGELSRAPADVISNSCAFGAQMATVDKPTISGEWSGALTDCAKYLNGRDIGARYDGTFNKDGQTSTKIGDCAGKASGTVADLPEADKTNIKNFINAQIVAYEKAAGWIFWTWKNEAAPEWHFQNLTKAGLVPQPFSAAVGC